MIGLGKEAKIRFEDSNFEILSSGDYVVCAVTGKHIPLSRLRYWSVELQEAYSSPEVVLKRMRKEKS